MQPVRRPSLVFFALAPLAACSGGGGDGSGGGDAHPRATSVVLFTVDTLRADRLGPWGDAGPPTPAVDALAAGSVVFERAYTQSTNTNPAMSSMLSGLIPPRHGAMNQTAPLAPDVLTLPEILGASGIRTGAFVANLCELQKVENTAWNEGWSHRFCGMAEHVEQYLWDRAVVDAATAWIEEVADEPFFAWVHLMDPHMEHRPPPEDWDYESDPLPRRLEQMRHYTALEEQGQTQPVPPAIVERLNTMYNAEVSGVDRELGRMLAFLDDPARGLDDVALVYSADHGEELFETWHRFGHGLSMTEGVLWVPLLVRAPGVAPDRRRTLVETLSITPTILGFFGIAPPYELDGPSLFDDVERGFARSFESRMALTLRSDEHRYWFRTTREPWTRKDAPWRADTPWFKNRESFATYTSGVPTTPTWLPIDDAAPALKHAFREQKEGILEQLERSPRPGEISDPEFLEQLEALGYM